MDYPDRIALAQLPTPLQPLKRISEYLDGPNIWVKRDDLTGAITSGNKIRKLEFTLKAAIDAGADTIITCGGLQSNHCRATAALCAQLGLQCELVLRGEAPSIYKANTLLDRLCGANIHCYPVRQYQQQLGELLKNLAEQLESQGKKPWVIPTGASDGYGVWGYVNAVKEMQQDFTSADLSPSSIVVASGSGGTQAGLIAGKVLHGFDGEIFGINVCDNEQYFTAKIQQDLAHFSRLYGIDLGDVKSEINILDGYVGAGYAKASKEVLQCIAKLASLEGIVLDPVYSGKAFYGLIQEVKKGRFKQGEDIIFIHTGGTFGLFDFESQITTDVFC